MNEREIRKHIFDLTKSLYDLRFAKQEFIPGTTPVRYAGRVYDETDLINLVDSSLDFWLTEGRFAEEFQSRFAEYMETEECIITNSGSSANLLAFTALTSPKLGDRRLKPGDEVITVAAGFPTTLAPIVQNGCIPVFVDVELGHYTADPVQLAQAVSPKTRAIFMAHTMGVPFYFDAVMTLAEEFDLWVIEDCCDAVGSRYEDKMVGTFGDLATVSFYPAHHMTMGEGGAILTRDENLARIVRSFRDWGRDCYCSGGENNTCGKRFTQQFGDLPYGYDHKYVYSHIGYNLKVTDMQAAVGCAQLDKIDDFVTARKKNHRCISDRLQKYGDRLILHYPTPKSDPSWFGYVITIRDEAGFTRSEIVSHLENAKIETRNLFAGNLLKHPAFMDIERRVIGDLPNTDRITENTFFIGVYPGMTPEMLDYVCDTFDEFFRDR